MQMHQRSSWKKQSRVTWQLRNKSLEQKSKNPSLVSHTTCCFCFEYFSLSLSLSDPYRLPRDSMWGVFFFANETAKKNEPLERHPFTSWHQIEFWHSFVKTYFSSSLFHHLLSSLQSFSEKASLLKTSVPVVQFCWWLSASGTTMIKHTLSFPVSHHRAPWEKWT